MNAPLPILAPGFTDPVFEAQAVFRAVMDAMARPGTISTLPEIAPPAPGLQSAAAAILLALADYETAVWLDPKIAGEAIGHYLKFHTGAPIVADKAAAVFAVADGPQGALAGLNPGTLDYPDRSATLVVQLASLVDGVPCQLTGPGIDGARAATIPAALIDPLIDNRALFPLGVDVILAAGRDILALPRSTALSCPKE